MKNSVFNKQCCSNWKATYRKIDPFVSPSIILNYKHIRDPKTNTDILNLIEEKVGSSFDLIGTRKRLPKLQALTSAINKQKLIIKKKEMQIKRIFDDQAYTRQNGGCQENKLQMLVRTWTKMSHYSWPPGI